MTNIVKIPAVNTAVSFSMETKRQVSPLLTKAQREIVLMVMDAYKKKKAISRDDIRGLYIQEMLQGKTFPVNVWHSKKGNFENKRVNGDHESVRAKINARSISWFKSNLASCVLKGYMIVVPVNRPELNANNVLLLDTSKPLTKGK